MGGKLCGAGGGGFLMFLVEHDKQKEVAAVLSDLPQLDINLDPRGTRIVSRL